MSLWAQQKGGAKQAVRPTVQRDTVGLARKKASRPVVYLGSSDFSGGVITTTEFREGLRRGISSKDESGNPLKIIGFNFIYGERRLFEDSVGDLKMMMDYALEYCPGDTVTPAVAASIYDNVKSGDTVIFSQVMVARKVGNDVDTIMGKELKCIIRKSK